MDIYYQHAEYESSAHSDERHAPKEGKLAGRLHTEPEKSFVENV